MEKKYGTQAYIEDAETNGKGLIRTKSDKYNVRKSPVSKSYEVMLLDKYILFENLVIPIEQIRWVVERNVTEKLELY